MVAPRSPPGVPPDVPGIGNDDANWPYDVADWTFGPAGAAAVGSSQVTCATPSAANQQCASWEQRIVRYASGWNVSGATISSAVASPSPAGQGSITSRTGNKLTWLVDIQYQFTPTVSGFAIVNPALSPAPAPLAPEASFRSTVLTALAGPAMAAPMAAVANSGTTDIDPAELALYQTLGGFTAGSRFRSFVFTTGTVYGVPHSVPGDVDNSGCTDQADLTQILQSDVWLQQAPAFDPNQAVQHTTLADLNADGWVNQLDLNMVLDNWGAGCTILPQPPLGGYVAIPYAPSGLAATPSVSQVSLTWLPSSMATSYEVLRSTTSGSGFVTLASGLTATSYTDTAVTAGTTYYYEVTATDSQGTSAASAEISAVVAAAPPPMPCANPATWTNGQAGSFNTTGAVCGRVAGTIHGWGCANFEGRKLAVDDEPVTCGETPVPAPWSDGYTYFSVTAGTYAYASIYWW